MLRNFAKQLTQQAKIPTNAKVSVGIFAFAEFVGNLKLRTFPGTQSFFIVQSDMHGRARLQSPKG